jgi:hypothetical protein
MSKRFTLSQKNTDDILKVAGWTIATAIVTALISIVGMIDFPIEYALVPAVINIILVAAKKWLENKV